MVANSFFSLTTIWMVVALGCLITFTILTIRFLFPQYPSDATLDVSRKQSANREMPSKALERNNDLSR